MSVSVTNLMKTQGRDVVLARATASNNTYDPATGTFTQPTPVTATMRGVMTNYADDEIDETRILGQDRKLLLDAKSDPFVPAIGDVADGTLSGNTITGGFTIKSVREISPNGIPAAYVCQVRG